MKTKILCMALLGSLCMPLWAQQVFDMTSLGVVPGKKTNMSPRVEKALDKIRKQAVSGKEVVLRFTPGVYHFYPNDAVEREYYISNHDQTNPKKLD